MIGHDDDSDTWPSTIVGRAYRRLALVVAIVVAWLLACVALLIALGAIR